MHLIPHYCLNFIFPNDRERPVQLDLKVRISKYEKVKWAAKIKQLEFREVDNKEFEVVVWTDKLHHALIYAMHNLQLLYVILGEVKNKQLVLNFILANPRRKFDWGSISYFACDDLNFIKQNLTHNGKPIPWDWTGITECIIEEYSIDIIFADPSFPWEWDAVSSHVDFNTFMDNLWFADGSLIPWNREILIDREDFVEAYAKHTFDQFYNSLLN